MHTRTIVLFAALQAVCLFPITVVSSHAQETASQEREVKELRAMRIPARAPVIDGQLDDDIWNQPGLDLARGFRQREPDEGAAASESTLVAVVYDDDAIYFGFWNFDSNPDQILAPLVRRDRESMADLILVSLDCHHDHQSGSYFAITAAGVLRDASISDDTNLDFDWDAVWDAAARIEPWGWSAEMRIPFSCLRFAEKDEHTWGLQITRLMGHSGEFSRWAFSPSSEGGYISRMGHLTGLTGIKPARHLEVLPYTVSSAQFDPDSPGNPDGRDLMGNMGFDLKYGLSSNLILDATVNPDFGQVEPDHPVLNLSTFETLYPEKRPFFLEGADLFNTRFNMFYSRRIGREPGNIDDDEFAYSTTRSQAATTILGAAKVTGKLPGGTSIAFINAVTQEEEAEYDAIVVRDADSTWEDEELVIDTIMADTVSRTVVIEPVANYSVLRLTQDVFTNSRIGGTVTLASQDARHPATAGGVDWRFSSADGSWVGQGQTVFSRNDGVNTGFGLDAEIQKLGGQHIRGEIGVTLRDPYLDLNRLGYQDRPDWQQGRLWVQYRTVDDWWVVRNSWNNFNLYGAWNYDGANIQKGWNWDGQIEFTNRWWLSGGFSENLSEYDDRETRGNGLWRYPRAWGWWASFTTDQSKVISLNLNPGSGEGRYGSWWAHWTGIEIRPRSNMEFAVGTNIVRTFGELRWVENRDDDAIFAYLDQDEIVLDLRASIMLHRNLSWQISGQGLISSLDYTNFRRHLGENNYRVIEESDKFDRNVSDLNSTMILRWEYRPGSTVYLVWTRSRSEKDMSVNDIDASRDLDRLFSRGASNVWMMKISYWWNP